MLIALICSKCEDKFAVERPYAKAEGGKAVVRVEFYCPYCQTKYKVGDKLKLMGTTGGVNIEASGNVNLSGDVAGRDLIKTDKG